MHPSFSFKYRSPTAFMLLGSCLLAPLVTAQQTDTLDFSGSAQLGAEYNSNITVDELETAANASDTALTFDGELNLEWHPVEHAIIESGYSYSASRFQDANAYDLDLHLLHVDLSYEFAPVTLGTNYYYANADLGGDDFLSLNQYSVYASHLFAQKFFLRGALNSSQKRFAQLASRNADDDGLSLDAFWFFNAGRSTFVLGYDYTDESTNGPEYKYKANTYRARFTQKFRMLARDASFQAGVRLQNRDYSNVTPLIGTSRDDKQRVADLELDLNLNKTFTLVSKLEAGDYQSNLASADFNDNRASIGIKASF